MFAGCAGPQSIQQLLIWPACRKKDQPCEQKTRMGEHEKGTFQPISIYIFSVSFQTPIIFRVSKIDFCQSL